MKRKENFKKLLYFIIAVIGLNIIGHFVFKRFDLTQDKRYTLSDTSLQIITNAKEPLYVEVYLEGNFPAEFKRLQTETKQILEEFSAYNSNIIFDFVDPNANQQNRVENLKKFFQQGLTPLNVTVTYKGKQSQEVIFPWAIVRYQNKTAKVALLKNMMGASVEDKIVTSVQHLEYAFTEAFNKVTVPKQKKIAVLKGNGELDDIQIADFLKTIKESYYIGPFTLDSVSTHPVESLKALQKYDLLMAAKPTEKFSEAEKQVLDQFVVNGGKVLWLMDAVQAEMDSLYNPTGTTLAYSDDLNLADWFFKYGFRIEPLLIKDEQATPIKLATGQHGSQTQYTEYLWKFSPFIYPKSNHPIVKNNEGIKFEFASPIDTLKNKLKKTVLLETSKYSKPLGVPLEISLSMVNEAFEPEKYIAKDSMPVAVLAEGKFTSMYKNRVLPFEDSSYRADAQKESKFILVSDGDIIKNQLDNGMPLELGYDKWTGNLYGNKDFLLNSINYLLDDTGIINIRTKDVRLPILNKEKVYENYSVIQWVAIGVPLVILAVFGFVFVWVRKRKYTK